MNSLGKVNVLVTLLTLLCLSCAGVGPKMVEQKSAIQMAPTSECLERIVHDIVQKGKVGDFKGVFSYYQDQKWHGWSWWQAKAITEMIQSSSGDSKILVCRAEKNLGATYFKVRIGEEYLPLHKYEDQAFMYWEWNADFKRWQSVQAVDKLHNPNQDEVSRWQEFVRSARGAKCAEGDRQAVEAAAARFMEYCVKGDESGAASMISEYSYFNSVGNSWSKDWLRQEDASWQCSRFRGAAKYQLTVSSAPAKGWDIGCAWIHISLQDTENTLIYGWRVGIAAEWPDGRQSGKEWLTMVFEDGQWRVWTY